MARGFIEAFNSKLRAECLNARWFMSLADAREKLEDWRRDYNEVRPHSAIGYNVPIDLHIPDGATSPSSWPEPGNSSPRRTKVGEQRSTCRAGLSPGRALKRLGGLMTV